MAGQSAGYALSGTGLGLRPVHIDRVLTEHLAVPWFELLGDNHTAPGGLTPRQLAAVRADYPVSFHWVGMSLGGIDPLDRDYLRRVRRMIRRYEPAQVSDHLSFSLHAGHYYHDLLPLPYTEEALAHVRGRIREAQDALGMRLLIENVSSYMSYRHSTLTEPEFIAALAETADCDLLLDINNAWVNQVNHGVPSRDYLRLLPRERIREIHLAGSLGLLQSNYPVMTIRAANRSGGDAAQVEASGRPEYLVVSRPLFAPQVDRVDGATFRLLDACAAGLTLGRIIAAGGDDAVAMAALLPRLVERGWLTAVRSHACAEDR